MQRHEGAALTGGQSKQFHSREQETKECEWGSCLLEVAVCV